MADINKLKESVKSTIFPNGRGAINATDHQAMLLDMVDGMAETDAALSKLGESTDAELAKLSEEVSQNQAMIESAFDLDTSRNLFDRTNTLENTRAGFDVGTRAGCKSSDWIPVESGKNYTISNKFISETGYCLAYKTIDDVVTTAAIYLSSSKSYTFTVNDFKEIQVGPYYKEAAETIETMQVEEGNIATDFVVGGKSLLPKTDKFAEMYESYAALYNESYEVGGCLTIKEITNGKPTKFEYVKPITQNAGTNSDLFEIGHNLYDPSKDDYGARADGTGASVNARRSEYIAIKPDCDYSMQGNPLRDVSAVITICDANKNIINAETGAIPARGNLKQKLIHTPGNAAFIRFSTYSATDNELIAEVMLSEGNYPLPYEPYYQYAKEDPLHPSNIWKNKRLWVDGDSITHAYIFAGDEYYTYWQFIAAKALDMRLDISVEGLGSENYANGWRGVGGSSIANEGGKNDPEHSIVLRYQEYSNDVDLVMIAAGTNDWGHGLVDLGEEDSLDITTFNGALNVLLPALKEKYPTIPVVMMTPIKRGANNAINQRGLKLEQFVDAMIKKCREYNVYCLDMWATCPINPNIAAMQETLYTRFNDAGERDLVHPGKKGQEIMGKTVTGFLRCL